MITKFEAIRSLVPNAEVTVRGDEIEWHNPSTAPITEEQIQAEIVRLEVEAAANSYKAKRAREYPPITDYIDGVVKGDQAQIDKYIADCLAVKAKYPKGA